MKGFCAVALAHVPLFLKSALHTPIHLVFSYDEETTCLGVIDPISRMGADLPRPRAVIVGEPTSMQPADAHKSVVIYNTHVHGFEAHSSKPELGASAIKGAVMLMAELDRIGEEMVARGDPTGRFDPPYTSVHIGEVHGGTARNIMAKLCSFYWEFRGVPGLDPGEIPMRLERYAQGTVLPRLTAHGKPASVETINEVSVPGLAPDPGSAAETLALGLTGRNRPITVPYGSEAGHFQNEGFATIVCGPGSVDQAHQPDEYITLEQIDAGAAFMRGLAQWCAANRLTRSSRWELPGTTWMDKRQKQSVVTQPSCRSSCSAQGRAARGVKFLPRPATPPARSPPARRGRRPSRIRKSP